jgi:hypothetical protein
MNRGPKFESNSLVLIREVLGDEFSPKVFWLDERRFHQFVANN